jgi:hypothetical protein
LVRDDLLRLLHHLTTGTSAHLPSPASGYGGRSGTLKGSRETIIKPILDAKGWSVLDWANESKLDVHTARNYLQGATTLRASTLIKLAKFLGLKVANLPE